MPLQPGARLGRYEIEGVLGAGGMGEVYRARDSRLNRAVAIKVLPSGLPADEELRQRFAREARVLATLSHQHICPIYDVGHEGGVDFLVMECLAGQTLAERVAGGPLAIDEVLQAGIQIAEALAAAHAHGIVHRDLKPGNVMLTKSGVKLLDFGIARRTGEAALTGTRDATLTAEGAIVGTLQYMAPEQLDGSAVDARADLFAFGALLYELVTGRAPFARATPSATAAAVLHQPVAPAAELRPGVPAALDRLIGLCLAKKPEDRWASAHDAALLLRSMPQDAPTQARGAAPAGGRSRLPWVVAAAAALAAIALAAALYGRPPAPDPLVTTLSVLPPPDMTFAPEETPQISPDGRQLLFVALDAAGETHLYVRGLASPQALPLQGSNGAVQPFWSPDSGSIGFFADGWLKVIDEPGNAPRNLARAPTPRGGSWSDDGTIIFVPFPAIPPHRVPASGGQATAVWQPDNPAAFRWFPQSLPGGAGYLFLTYSFKGLDSRVSLGRLDDTGATALVDSTSAAIYGNPGHLLVRRDGAVTAYAFDARTGSISGDPVRLFTGPGINPITVQTPFSVSRNGVLAYIERTLTSQLTRVDRTGRAIGNVGTRGSYNSICASADGSRVVADGVAGDDLNIDIWSAREGAASRLTFHEAIDFYPVCSPDGREIVFASLRLGPPALFRMSVDAPGTETLLLDNKVATLPIDWSADGRWLLYGTITDRGDWDIWALPRGGGKPSPLVATPAEERQARISPDGRWLAYTSNETGRFEVYVQPFPSTGARWQVSRDGGVQPQWRGDGRELFYLAGDRTTTAVDASVDGRTFVAGPPRRLFQARAAGLERMGVGIQYAVSSRGDSFVVNRLSDEATGRAVTVVLNWPALLQR